MTFSHSLTAAALSTLLLSSCSQNEIVEEEPATPTPAPFAPPKIEPEAVVKAPPVQDHGFADPDTTSKLITREETKTFVGDLPKTSPVKNIDENVINVTTPSLPDAQLPEVKTPVAPAN